MSYNQDSQSHLFGGVESPFLPYDLTLDNADAYVRAHKEVRVESNTTPDCWSRFCTTAFSSMFTTVIIGDTLLFITHQGTIVSEAARAQIRSSYTFFSPRKDICGKETAYTAYQPYCNRQTVMPTVPRSEEEYIVVLGHSGVQDSSIGLPQLCSFAAVLSPIALVFIRFLAVYRQKIGNTSCCRPKQWKSGQAHVFRTPRYRAR